MTVNRSRLNWGFFLLVLGAVPLAVEVGLIDRPIAAQIVALWPLALIALGIGLMLRFNPPARAVGGLLVAVTLGVIGGALIAAGGHGFSGGCLNGPLGGSSSPVTRSGTLAASGTVSIEISCANLTINREAGGGWSVVVEQGAGNPPIIEQSGDHLRMATSETGVVLPGTRRTWQVTLPTEGIGSLATTTNASDARLNLGGGPLLGLDGTFNASDTRIDLTTADMTGARIVLTLNASSGTLLLPASGAGAGSTLTLNASSLTVCTPPGLGLRIPYSDTLSSDNFAAAGLTKVGDAWQTVGYELATARVELVAKANVSSLNVDLFGGCQ